MVRFECKFTVTLVADDERFCFKTAHMLDEA